MRKLYEVHETDMDPILLRNILDLEEAWKITQSQLVNWLLENTRLHTHFSSEARNNWRKRNKRFKILLC